jgi:diacylglycerol kinase (ATP)
MKHLKSIILNWLSGIRLAWKGNTAFRKMSVVSVAGILVGMMVRISALELALLIALACISFGLEVANTSIETLCNIVKPEHCNEVKTIKDAFSAVPIFCYSAYVICWLILVLPKLIGRF